MATERARATSFRQLWWVVLLLASWLIAVPRGPLTALAVLAVLMLPVTLPRSRALLGRRPTVWLTASVGVVVLSALIHLAHAWSTALAMFLPVAAALVGMFLLWCVDSCGLSIGASAVAIAIGSVPSALSQHAAGTGGMLKGGVGESVALILFAYAGRMRRRTGVFLIGLVLGGWLFLEDFRSLGATCVLAGLIPAVVPYARRLRLRSALAGGIIVIFLALGTFRLYGALAAGGELGDQAQETYRSQTMGGANLLLKGRSELFVSDVAIADHPWLGRGAKVPLTAAERQEAVNLANSHGVVWGEENIERLFLVDGVNDHSVLFGSWVVAGILGPIVWMSVWLWIAAGAMLACVRRTRLAPLLAFGVLSVGWSLLFSPWNAREETTIGMFVGAAAVSIVSARNTRGSDSRERSSSVVAGS